MRLKNYIKEEKEGMGADGLSKQRLKTLIYKETKKCTFNKIYNDPYWKGPSCIWSVFDKLNLNWQIDSSEYKTNNKENLMPDAKEWKITIMWTDNKGKSQKQGGIVTAAGAGSVDDPLDKYDVNLVLF